MDDTAIIAKETTLINQEQWAYPGEITKIGNRELKEFDHFKCIGNVLKGGAQCPGKSKYWIKEVIGFMAQKTGR